jgi:nicotinic acid mononucleotide adenylyltransferase
MGQKTIPKTLIFIKLFMYTHPLVIYGGAFSPPTIGHKAVIDGLIREGIAEKVLLVPSGMR